MSYTHRHELLELLPGVGEGLKLLAQLPCHLIVVSNQAGIGLGIFTEKDMRDFNAALRLRVGAADGRLDAFYYCPHLEKKDLPAGAALCECSKPAPGLIFEAAEDYNLDLKRSFLIGDRETDVLAGRAAHCRTILLSAVPAQTSATYVAANLTQAAQWIRTQVEG